MVPSATAASDPAILYAVEDDMRSTLRLAWLDPALRRLSAEPMFFIAAWSAVRPNITKSFSLGAEAMRAAAVEQLRRRGLQSRRRSLPDDLAPADRQALIRTLQTLHYGAARMALVVQAWAGLARRQRISGTGKEESPAKRGVPDWQMGLRAFRESPPDAAVETLGRASSALGTPRSPRSLQAISAWPSFLEAAWEQLAPNVGSEGWREAVAGVRAAGAQALRTLPHPMELQWDALGRRGLSEDRRQAVADELTVMARVMPIDVTISSFLWVAAAVPDIPVES